MDKQVQNRGKIEIRQFLESFWGKTPGKHTFLKTSTFLRKIHFFSKKLFLNFFHTNTLEQKNGNSHAEAPQIFDKNTRFFNKNQTNYTHLQQTKNTAISRESAAQKRINSKKTQRKTENRQNHAEAPHQHGFFSINTNN